MPSFWRCCGLKLWFSVLSSLPYLVSFANTVLHASVPGVLCLILNTNYNSGYWVLEPAVQPVFKQSSSLSSPSLINENAVGFSIKSLLEVKLYCTALSSCGIELLLVNLFWTFMMLPYCPLRICELFPRRLASWPCQWLWWGWPGLWVSGSAQLIACLHVSHKCPTGSPGCCNMEESPAGVNGTRVLFCLFCQTLGHSFFFKKYKCCKSNDDKRPTTLASNSQAHVLEVEAVLAWGKSSHRGYNLVHVVLWYLGMNHMLPLILMSKLFMTVGKGKLYSSQLCWCTPLNFLSCYLLLKCHFHIGDLWVNIASGKNAFRSYVIV